MMSDKRGVEQVQKSAWLLGGRRFDFGRLWRGKAKGVSDEEYQLLSVRELMWRKFRRNRMALISIVVLLFLYLMMIFAGFVAPYGIQNGKAALSFAPPMRVRFYNPETRLFSLRPFTFPLEGARNTETFQLEYKENRAKPTPLRLFVTGDSYKILGFIEADKHLYGTENEEVRIYILGADQRGRDLFSRIVYGSQVSLTVGIVGVGLTVLLGSIIGTLSGYYGGLFDSLMQRLIETLRTFPHLPLWMALAAAIPPNWPPERVYAGIVMVLALINWTGLAREIRGMVLSMKERDFISAAEATGASTARIVRKHLIPNMSSHIIVVGTLAVPGTILAESALSFLGIGVRAPMVSWGVLLNDAIKVQTIGLQPWLLFPSVFIIVTVMAYNFLGDGLRDVADPFSR